LFYPADRVFDHQAPPGCRQAMCRQQPWISGRFEPSPRLAAGKVHRKDESLFSVHSLTPPHRCSVSLLHSDKQRGMRSLSRFKIEPVGFRHHSVPLRQGLRCNKDRRRRTGAPGSVASGFRIHPPRPAGQSSPVASPSAREVVPRSP